MPGRLLFKEKQLRLCIVAALTAIAAPVAESLVLPPNPLASNISWSCQSGMSNDWLCNGISEQSYKSESDMQYAEIPEPELPDRHQPYAKADDENYHPLPAASGDSKALVSLLESPENHYVLQWMAAKERNQLEALKQRYPVLKDATIAQYKRSGKLWYVLLDGPYPNRTAAMAELDSPPRSHMAQELYPWTRSMASIRKLDIIRPEYTEEQFVKTDHPDYQPELSVQSHFAPADYEISYSTGQNSQQTPAQKADYFQRTLSVSNSDDSPSTPTEHGTRRATQAELVVPYGSEFSDDAFPDFNGGQNYSMVAGQANPQDMYVSITPAYQSSTPRHYSRQNVNYNVQDMPVSVTPEYTEQRVNEHPEQLLSPSSINVLAANPKSYTIEWMNASRKASLERAKRRYNELENTQIIHYQRNSINRYALVSMTFVNRSDALNALLTPSLSRVSARFSPKVRQVAYLQSLVGSTAQVTHAWAEPVVNKRQRIGQDDSEDKSYIAGREGFDQQPVDVRLMSSHKTGTASIGQPMVARSGHKSDTAISIGSHFLQGERSDSRRLVDALPNNLENGYTIQWFSSSNRQSIEKLKQRFPELASAVTVHVQRNQRDWYVLVQGQYRNSQEAVMALKSPTMQNIAMILHPWTRPLESLKKLQIASL